ncbi:helix-turn-helix domain-containing protein [Streptomyces sp. NPDC006711]|uniref:helix-turn-helix domain-containing protein n=1 Tax=Streptomyces sp. NPDC006711 TaxID=3364762 RepID=UPI00368086E9
MPSSPLSSVEAARKSVAIRLRGLRLDADLTMQGLADLCQWSKSKVSRIEALKTVPADADIRAWCTGCGTPEEATDLIAASRGAETMYVEWRRLQRSGLRRRQEAIVPLFERTRRFRVYCSRVIPGTLQTEAYARALLSTIARFRGIPDDSAQAATARFERSHSILYQGDRRFAMIVEEDVLHYQHGDAATMAGQLHHLLHVMGLPNVSLGVIPRTTPRDMWGQETFSIYDEDRVHIELLSAKVTVTQPSDIALYAQAFAELSKMAIHGNPARALIRDALEFFG